MKAHPVPLRDAALCQLSGKSAALDVYIWLAYRLHRLERPTPISWSALFGQFGAGFKALRQFKQKFSSTLKLALAAYPEARVTMGETKGSCCSRPTRPSAIERAIQPAERPTAVFSGSSPH